MSNGGFAMSLTPAHIWPIVLLGLSNIFMTFAWYGHLRFKAAPILVVIAISWGIAFFEYCLAVPANRIGHAVYSAAQLKTIQEVMTLSVFAIFSVVYLKEAISMGTLIGFAFIALGAWFVFRG
ncbi:DMT family protein [Aquisalinus flavus]|nr:DMT family protein [Aquisalinus flavus]